MLLGDICLSHFSRHCSNSRCYPSEQIKEFQDWKNLKEGNTRAEICNWGFLDGLQLCELLKINLKCQHICAFSSQKMSICFVRFSKELVAP